MPVEHVSWDDAQLFCQKLSQMTGEKYKLPSEAEWEYACRAGTIDAYSGALTVMAWYDTNSKNKTHAVGQKQPNASGLFDMHGNVSEWCEDTEHSDYNGAPADGSAWLRGGNSSRRILRGGSWFSNESHCRSAYRNYVLADTRNNTIGFRVVMSAKIP